jgi:hypothetical protein
MAATQALTSTWGEHPRYPTQLPALNVHTSVSATAGCPQLEKTPLAASTSFLQASAPLNSSSSQLQPATMTAAKAKMSASAET